MFVLVVKILRTCCNYHLPCTVLWIDSTLVHAFGAPPPSHALLVNAWNVGIEKRLNVFWRRLGIRKLLVFCAFTQKKPPLPRRGLNLPVICVGHLLVRQRITGSTVRIGLAAGTVSIPELVIWLDRGEKIRLVILCINSQSLGQSRCFYSHHA